LRATCRTKNPSARSIKPYCLPGKNRLKQPITQSSRDSVCSKRQNYSRALLSITSSSEPYAGGCAAACNGNGRDIWPESHCSWHSVRRQHLRQRSRSVGFALSLGPLLLPITTPQQPGTVGKDSGWIRSCCFPIPCTPDSGQQYHNYGPTGLPTMYSAITIDGNRSMIWRVKSGPSFHIFSVARTGSLTLQETTVSGSSGGSVGALFNGGILNIKSSTIPGNIGCGVDNSYYNDGIGSGITPSTTAPYPVIPAAVSLLSTRKDSLFPIAQFQQPRLRRIRRLN
jgi:hypothetical protein